MTVRREGGEAREEEEKAAGAWSLLPIYAHRLDTHLPHPLTLHHPPTHAHAHATEIEEVLDSNDEEEEEQQEEREQTRTEEGRGGGRKTGRMRMNEVRKQGREAAKGIGIEKAVSNDVQLSWSRGSQSW